MPVSEDEQRQIDERCMRRALELAERGRGCVEPNPVVGAVVVKNDELLAEGCHERFGKAHAEVNAIHRAGDRCAGATLYVTLEPCSTQGKQPPCTDAVLAAGLKRVVIGCVDHNPAHAGRGVRVLRDAGVEVEVGVCADECLLANAGFFKWINSPLPFVNTKWAMSADGKTAAATGRSRWISCDESRRRVHEMRGRVDAVIVGIGTALADDPMLTCRDAEVRRAARRVVVDSSARLPMDSRLVQTARQTPTALATTADAPQDKLGELAGAGCEIMVCAAGEDGRVNLADMLRKLKTDGACNVLVEGGSILLGGLFEEELVDRVTVFVAPLLLCGTQSPSAVGGKGVQDIADAIRLRMPRWSQIGCDVMLEAEVEYPRAAKQ